MKRFVLFLLCASLQVQGDAQLDNKTIDCIYNTFLYDTLGRLKIDTTKSIFPSELKQIKDNRELISAQLLSALHDYELEIIKLDLEKPDFDIFNLSPYQIRDTTKHVYNITCDNLGILNIEHTLLSSNIIYGSLSDSIIRKSIRSIFPYLKINDNQIHQYYIPIIYIPNRHKRTKSISYYCNCHFVPNNIDHINLDCKNNQKQQSVIGIPFNNGFKKTGASSKLDEFYFVIADGHPWSLGPSDTVIPSRREIIPIQSKKKWWRRKNKVE